MPSKCKAALFLFHGFRSDASSMQWLGRELSAGFDQVVTIDVNLGFQTLEQALADCVDQIQANDFSQAFFVGHSTGGLLIRLLLHHHPELAMKTQAAVLIGVPNKGTPLADVHQSVLPGLVAGLHKPIKQLTRKYHSQLEELPVPKTVALGGIAGIEGLAITAPFFRGPNDGVVAFSSVFLPQMTDLIALPLDHFGLIQSEVAAAAILSFFESKRFPAELFRMNLMSLADKFIKLYHLQHFDLLFKHCPNINAEIATIKGKMFWENLAEVNGWMLQKNRVFGQVRILNPSGIRKAWGTENQLSDAMDLTLSRHYSNEFMQSL